MKLLESKKYKLILSVSAIWLTTFTGAQLYTPIVNPQSVQVSADIKANVIKWGNSTWALANDGELVLTDGDIGTPAKPLYQTVSDEGIDPALIKSIEFTQKTSASNISWMFAYLPNLTKVVGMKNLNYSGTAEGMFNRDNLITNIDLAGFNTSNITNMASMFAYSGFEKLDLSEFDTSNVTTMGAMFDGSNKLSELNIKNFNTKKVKNMSYMFYSNPSSDLDLSSFDTSNIENMVGMFDSTHNLTALDLSNFNTAKLNNMQYMFIDSGIKRLNLSSFDTSNVTNMKNVFSGDLEELDLSSFTINDNTNTKSMFAGANKLKQLTLGKKTQLKSDMTIHDVPSTGGYSGHWQNVNGGTIDNPTEKNIWTSKELMSKFDAPTMGDDTYVWQKASGDTISIGKITDYTSDSDLTKYVPTATHPVKPYRYNVVLNHEYPFYSKLEEGQHIDENTVELGDETGATVYNRKNARITYTSGEQAGKTVNFVEVSFDGKTWYWVDEHALNLALSDTYPASNKSGISLIDGMFLGSTLTFGVVPSGLDVNSQMVGNAFNDKGKIVYKSLAKESDFSDQDDPTKALKAFNDNLDRAAKSWNDALNLGEPVLVNANTVKDPVSLTVWVGKAGGGSATANGDSHIDESYIKYGMDSNSQYYDINLLFITMRHELGHSLGLNHTAGGQYYGMPDDYKFSIDDDVMNGVLVLDPDAGYPWTQKTITENSLNAIKMILKNHNFQNPNRENEKDAESKTIETEKYEIIEKKKIQSNT